jgi:hypothetical protein
VGIATIVELVMHRNRKRTVYKTAAKTVSTRCWSRPNALLPRKNLPEMFAGFNPSALWA